MTVEVTVHQPNFIRPTYAELTEEDTFVRTYAPLFRDHIDTDRLKTILGRFYQGGKHREFEPHLLVEAAMRNGCLRMATQLVEAFITQVEADFEIGFMDSESYSSVGGALKLQELAIAKQIV